jgi:ferredoxin
MPYIVQKLCGGTETACVDACPYDCIYPNKDEFSLQPLYTIDAETCTNCGACALVCPEGAIAPAAEYGHYAGAAASAKRPYDSHLQVWSSAAPAPPLDLTATELFTAFAASHP